MLDTLESKPNLSELQHVVKPLIANRWEEVGTALGLADDDDGEQLGRTGMEIVECASMMR